MNSLHITLVALIVVSGISGIVADNVEISCTAFLYGQNDWAMNDTIPTTSHCIEEVQRARQYCGGTKINFVVTQFWFDHANAGIPDSFGTKIGWAVVPVNQSNLDILKTGMTNCFAAAVENGFTTIEVTPHIDDGLGRGAWRNTLIMNPLRKYDGVYSYYDIIIKPLVLALDTATSSVPNVKVYMSMQGEMNLMLWLYPMDWLRMAKSVKCMLPAGAKTGVSVNFNKLCGDYCNQNILSKLNLTNVHTLLTSVDFLGMSSYPITSVNPQPAEFQNAILSLSDEFKSLGVDLQSLSQPGGLELHFSEFGNGGAACSGGPAATPQSAVECPYFGVFSDFDPTRNPWATPAMQSFITNWYQQAIKWAAAGTGPTYKIKNVYIWNVASWDVTGIYHTDIDSTGAYRVPGVVTALKNWNDNGVVPA